SLLIGLIGGQPEGLPQGIIIAIDPYGSRRTQESPESFGGKKIRTVQLVIAHANIHAHEAIACGARGEQCSKFRTDDALVEIEQSILDEVRPLLSRKHQA